MTDKPDVGKYVENIVEGNNKMYSALDAGYSYSTASKPSIIESTQRYAVKVHEILHDNIDNLSILMSHYRKAIEKTPPDLKEAYLVMQIAEKQTKVHDILTPKVTVKEVQNKDGTVTRTAWGTNSSQLNETLRSGE